LDYDYGFDQFHQDSDRIFRLEFVQNTSAWSVHSGPLAERFFESSPDIIAGAMSNPMASEIVLHVENDGKRNYYREKAIHVSPGFTDVFTFEMVEGVDDALKAPNQVIIPLSLARKLFDDEPAVGKQMVFSEEQRTVGAVYRDFPANTVVNNCIYMPIVEDEIHQSWNAWGYHVYIRVNQESNVPLLFDNFKRNFDGRSAYGDSFDWDESGDYLRLTALPDIHYVTDVQYDFTPKASRQTLLILFAIAIIIVAIAAINFTNFSTALTPMRVKSINTQKVLGARQRTLRLSLVFEAVFISLLSFLTAVCLVVCFQHSPPARLVDADLSLTAHPLIVGGTALVAMLAGLLAGVYPARYMTSFAPALVLKGSFGLSPKGKKLRNSLTGIQFVASFMLIIGASFMYLQNHFMQHSSLGYEKDALITVDIGQIQGSREAFTNQVKTFSGIEDVTYGEALLSSSDGYWKWGRRYKGESITFQVFPVHHTFLKVMGIEITGGRDFRQEDTNTQSGAFIFNETARRQFGLELDTSIEGNARYGNGVITGFMSDIKIASFRMAVEPMAFYVWGTENLGLQPNHAYIKLKAGTNLHAAMSHVHTTLGGFDTDYPFEVRFFDEILQRLYEKETSLSLLISLFSLISIFISIVGVFGLVVFDSECRRKEIGIRKVLGASTTGIILMFNKVYIRILAICFVIAAPLAWYAVNLWLQNFAYRTPMYWWVYLLAFAAVGIITAGTVTFQNWRVANDDPVKAIMSSE
jgi:putative ABC transport system permease protein